jgi:succinoglycan biosynthesis protein ExoA
MSADYIPRDSIRSLWRQYLGYGEFRALTALRHPRGMRASHLLPPGVVLAAGAAIAAPRGLRRAARLGMAAYGVSLASAGLRARGRVDSARTAALLPVVLATMHFGHGAGQLKGWVKYGPPLRAFAVVAGLGGLLSQSEPGAEAVFAPSLRRFDAVNQAAEPAIR